MTITFYERCTSGCEYRNKCSLYKELKQVPIFEKSAQDCENDDKGKLEKCLTRKGYFKQDAEMSQLAKYFAKQIVERNLH